MKKLILWIHGFAGRPNNETVCEMRRLLTSCDIFSIEVDHHALASMGKIDQFIATHDVCLVAGTSLGGFYAMCANFDGPKIVVNPVSDPVRDLRQFLGHNVYKPGRPDGQSDFDFTEEHLREFALLEPTPLDKVVCHHSEHDSVLGDDIHNDYQANFLHIKQIDAALLPDHFLTFKYVKMQFCKTVEKLLLLSASDL